MVVLLAAAAVLFPAQAGAAPVIRRLAVVTIQNGDTDNERAQLADTTYLRNVFFSGGGGGSLASWMPAVTHGRLGFVPAGDGVFAAEPNAALRDGARNRCLSDAARSTAEGFLSGRGIAWDSLAVVFDIGSCGWGGLGQMPGKVTWYPPRPSLSAIVHEFGHNLGYPHQLKRDCSGGAVSECRVSGVSGTSPMGGGGSGRGYSAVELMHSGWVEPGWLVRTGRPGSFTLKPLHSPASTTGTRVVEFQTSGGTSYVIEARASSSSGVDSAFGGNPALKVYSVNNKDYRNAWLVNPGGPVITDAAHKITISLRSATTVEIATTGAVSARPSPNRAAPAAPPSPSPSATASPAGPSATPEPDHFDDPDSLADSLIPPRGLPSPGALPLLAAGIALTAAAVLGALLFALPGRRRRGRHAA
jgi:hypothetical protein